MPDAVHVFHTEPDDIVARTRTFIEEVCIPEELAQRARNHWPTDELRLELVGKAREAGVYGPHLPVELGGLGLPWVKRAQVFQAAGYSMLGPGALHCSAPDEGNHHLLHMVASDAQKEQFLAPLVHDAKRSCFMMSEPDGAGADPTQMT
ncbi:MAG: acyl-CoA dehydrogenase family protein, partial [Pseudomonadota bacterium]